jgi:hypothetical protein
MIKAKLVTILATSGCTKVYYEQDKLANLIIDQGLQSDIIGLITQPNEITLEVKANAIMEHYPPYVIEVMQQVRLEDDADDYTVTSNEVKLQQCLDICKKIILNIIGAAQNKVPFAGLGLNLGKIKTIQLTKILETRYDANVIGWSMPLDVTRLLNENKDPCL